MVIFVIVSIKSKWWWPCSIKMLVESLNFYLHTGHTRYVNIVVYIMCLYLDTTLQALRVLVTLGNNNPQHLLFIFSRGTVLLVLRQLWHACQF